MPLVAYNIDLASSNIALARKIAGDIRRDRRVLPELEGVRALGLWLPRRGRAQISMNVTRPQETPLAPLFDYVRGRAMEAGEEVWGSEIVGLAPRASLGAEPPQRILWNGYRESQIVEHWIARA
jgi:glutamate formiminotransferase